MALGGQPKIVKSICFFKENLHKSGDSEIIPFFLSSLEPCLRACCMFEILLGTFLIEFIVHVCSGTCHAGWHWLRLAVSTVVPEDSGKLTSVQTPGFRSMSIDGGNHFPYVK